MEPRFCKKNNSDNNNENIGVAIIENMIICDNNDCDTIREKKTYVMSEIIIVK